MTRIRYGYIKNMVNSLFINLEISSYPIHIINIFSNFKNCRLVSYSKHMKRYNLSEEEVIAYFGSDEGCTIYNAKKNRYLVFYNDLNAYYKTPPRRRWTVAHELGHILLSHLTITNKVRIFRNGLTDKEYNWLEAEANRFASLLLADPVILYKLNIKDNFDIMKICKLSEEASKYRYSGYLKWTKHKYVNKYDCIIINQFHDFIYKKHCFICGHTFVSENAKYCPICGNNKLIWGDEKMIYPDEYELDENGRAKVCPKCGNEITFNDGEFCDVCGAYLINRCSNVECTFDNEPCGKPANGHARYCKYCGSTTTFYNFGFLKDWETGKTYKQLEKEKTEAETAAQKQALDDGDIPF